MAALSSSDAFVKALDSEKIVLVVGIFDRNGLKVDEVKMSISKDILFEKSPVIAKLVQQREDQQSVKISKTSVASVKMFIEWCYKERLPVRNSKPTSLQQTQWKYTLIDLWAFAGRYEIIALQNEVMTNLINFLDDASVFLLEDVSYIWGATCGLTYELRTLAAFVLVAKIQDRDDKTKPEDLDKLCKLKGLISDIYSATERWTKFQPPASPRKDKRSKWLKFMEKDEIKYLLTAELQVEIEETPPPSCPVARSAASGPTKTKVEPEAMMGIKKEAESPVKVKKEERVEKPVYVRHEDDDELQEVPRPPKNTDIEMIDLTEDD